MGLSFRFPLELGAGDDTHEQVHNAILAALEPAYDVSYGTALWSETYGDASIIEVMWACNRRVANQFWPSRMLENLTVWETATGLRPVLGTTDNERRAALSAKLRGLDGNTVGDISEIITTILGDNFEAIHAVDSTEEITYWPGVNPGPPGFEWSTNKARLCVQYNEDGLAPSTLERKLETLVAQLNSVLPSWQTFCVGTDSAFLVGVGLVGKTLL